MKEIKISQIYEVISVLKKKIRTSENYWQYISETKHPDLKNRLKDVLESLNKADEVWQNPEVKNFYFYYQKINKHWICVITRHLNGDGFIVTAYLTSKSKRKGKKIWQKK
ncbi:DUF4258 domain-containing protein [Candidatus Kuenenbacteria bacterium]|nr:DUF4258 domain-containing protein [Candidatus Kuenenbacteria bacterium]